MVRIRAYDLRRKSLLETVCSKDALKVRRSLGEVLIQRVFRV